MDKQTKKNLLMYPLGTVGRDMMYALFNSYLLTYTMYTRSLTNAQLSAITIIMVAARVFDALNDPIMGNLIERTRSKYGKFKPWLLTGILSTSVVIYVIFNSKLEGWAFIVEFGICYFLYSITFTMHDISYWGMIPALSSDGAMRDTYTSRATLFGGIGNTLAQILIPMLTAGALALGGSSRNAYGIIATVICILGPLFLLFTLFGVKERREDNKKVPPLSFKKIISTFVNNDQLLWITFIFLLQQIGINIVLNGIGNNYIYFEFGYKGSLYSLFTTVGMAATAFLMIFYPLLSKKLSRNKMVSVALYIGIVGYSIQILCGLFMVTSQLKFIMITLGFMLSNFAQYGLYLIMMISIINTVEYNELKTGNRDEAIISSVRPFITKLASALVVVITTLTYMVVNATSFTNQISSLEQQATQGLIDDLTKSKMIEAIIGSTTSLQRNGLLIAMTIIPCIFMILSCVLYKKKYILSEEKYKEICEQLDIS